MKLLATIKNSDIYPIEGDKVEFLKERKAARAIVFDNEDKVALLHVSNKHYYKLPGRGVETGESIEEALKRECLEEIGCNIKITNEVGEIIEYRGKLNMCQKSYCFIANVLGEKGEPSFTKEEFDGGFEINWLGLEDAISKVKNSKPLGYQGNFIIKRDLIFLEEAQSLISNNM